MPVINGQLPLHDAEWTHLQMHLEEGGKERYQTSLKLLVLNLLKINDKPLIMNAGRKMGELQYNGLKISI